MNTIYDFFKKNNFIIKKKIYYEQNYLNFITTLNNYDLILINGEGTIHGEINSDTKKVKEILDFIKISKKYYHVPIVIFNSTIASLNKNQLKIIKMVDKIYVREKYSYNYLKKKRIRSKILPDFLSLLSLQNINQGKKIIVTDSSIQKTTKKLFNYAQLKKYEYIPILYNNYLRYLRFFTFKFALKLRMNFIVNFYTHLKNLFLKKFLDQISVSNFIITGRFHAIFICLALNKPFYTFDSDTYKIRGLINILGLKNRIININKIKNLKLIKFNKSEILKIKKFKKNSKKKFNKFIQELSALRTL